PIAAAAESELGAGRRPATALAPVCGSTRRIWSSCEVASPPPKTYTEPPSAAAAVSWRALGSEPSVRPPRAVAETTSALEAPALVRPPARINRPAATAADGSRSGAGRRPVVRSARWSGACSATARARRAGDERDTGEDRSTHRLGGCQGRSRVRAKNG